MRILIHSFFIFVVVFLVLTKRTQSYRIKGNDTQVEPNMNRENEKKANVTKEDNTKVENENKEETKKEEKEGNQRKDTPEKKCGIECNETQDSMKKPDEPPNNSNDNAKEDTVNTFKASSQAENETSKLFNEALKEINISEEGLVFAKDVCENVVTKNRYFEQLCNRNDLFQALETIRSKNVDVYNKIMHGTYESKDLFNFQMLSSVNYEKIYVEHDMHHPKSSILFLFGKFCIGGIPLACGTITKYNTVDELNNFTISSNYKETNKVDEKQENSNSNLTNSN